MCIESNRVLAQRHGGIPEAFDDVISVQKKAFIGYLQCTYFLAYTAPNFLHLSNCPNLLDLGVYLWARIVSTLLNISCKR